MNQKHILITILVLFCVSQSVQTIDNSSDTNEIDTNTERDDVIQVAEPYRYMIQSTARFALTQTNIVRHISIDTAMDLLSTLAFLLARPKILIGMVGTAAAAIVSLIFITVFSPASFKFIEEVWKHPSMFLSNGLEERSVMSIVRMQTENLINKLGLSDEICRKKSFCFAGELIRSCYPRASKKLAKFAAENISAPEIIDNPSVKAFVSGYMHQNCTAIKPEPNQPCLPGFIASIIGLSKLHQQQHNHRLLPKW